MEVVLLWWKRSTTPIEIIQIHSQVTINRSDIITVCAGGGVRWAWSLSPSFFASCFGVFCRLVNEAFAVVVQEGGVNAPLKKTFIAWSSYFALNEACVRLPTFDLVELTALGLVRVVCWDVAPLSLLLVEYVTTTGVTSFPVPVDVWFVVSGAGASFLHGWAAEGNTPPLRKEWEPFLTAGTAMTLVLHGVANFWSGIGSTVNIICFVFEDEADTELFADMAIWVFAVGAENTVEHWGESSSRFSVDAETLFVVAVIFKPQSVGWATL